MKIRMVAAFCAAVLVFTVSGCRLANPDMGDREQETDRLAGVFITTEYLDLFDMESYISQNLNMIQGAEAVLVSGAEKYQGRLYAIETENTAVNEDTGEKTSYTEYVFPDIAGISFFYAQIPPRGGLNGYGITVMDPAISDSHTAVNAGDGQTFTTLSGTLYVLPLADRVFYINPVYQSDDGRIYAVPGGGVSASGVDSEGAMITQTLEDKWTITQNGVSAEYGMSVSIAISVMFSPEELVILQMDGQGAVVKRTQYSPGGFPATLRPEKQADFIIVETRKKGAVSRQICARENESVLTFSPTDNGLCVGRYSQILWP